MRDVRRALYARRISTEIVVVAGAHDLETDARRRRCPDWELGPGASLRCGLAALPATRRGSRRRPRRRPRSLERRRPARRRGLARARRARSWPRATTACAAIRVLVARSEWADVPDEGLRGREPLLVPCDDLGHPGDVDRPGRSAREVQDHARRTDVDTDGARSPASTRRRAAAARRAAAHPTAPRAGAARPLGARLGAISSAA